MKHLEDEDIGKMIEGTVSKNERENFLKHLSECDSCLTVYTETYKFVEEERKPKINERIIKLIEKLANHPFWQYIRTQFKTRRPRLVPTFAVLIIILLIVPFVLKEHHDRSILYDKIKQTVVGRESMGGHAFAPSRDQNYAAIRAGMLVKDLSLLVNTNEKEMTTKTGKMLIHELKKIFKSETDSLEQRIRELIEKQSLSELFKFGWFVEDTILSTAENKTPNQDDIEKYQQTIQKYRDKLPQGVFKKLDNIKSTSGVKKIEEVFVDIREIFLPLE